MRIGYWHFPFLGDESFTAAEASECAADQDAFWEYHDALFENQGGENQGAFSVENLKKIAGDLNLDQEAFDECLDTNKYTSLVQDQANVARSLGVSSTPAFLINATPVMGSLPFQDFQQIIEGELAKQ